MVWFLCFGTVLHLQWDFNSVFLLLYIKFMCYFLWSALSHCEVTKTYLFNKKISFQFKCSCSSKVIDQSNVMRSQAEFFIGFKLYLKSITDEHLLRSIKSISFHQITDIVCQMKIVQFGKNNHPLNKYWTFQSLLWHTYVNYKDWLKWNWQKK